MWPRSGRRPRECHRGRLVASRAGDGKAGLNRDDIKQMEAPLKMPNGKPLRAQPAMDLWSLGMIAYELFANEVSQ